MFVAAAAATSHAETARTRMPWRSRVSMVRGAAAAVNARAHGFGRERTPQDDDQDSSKMAPMTSDVRRRSRLANGTAHR
eukprot:3141156-Prymnesium_polylepis.1